MKQDHLPFHCIFSKIAASLNDLVCFCTKPQCTLFLPAFYASLTSSIFYGLMVSSMEIDWPITLFSKCLAHEIEISNTDIVFLCNTSTAIFECEKKHVKHTDINHDKLHRCQATNSYHFFCGYHTNYNVYDTRYKVTHESIYITL